MIGKIKKSFAVLRCVWFGHTGPRMKWKFDKGSWVCRIHMSWNCYRCGVYQEKVVSNSETS